MVSIGLSLLTVAIETGGQNIAKYRCLLKLCQNEVKRALFRLVQVFCHASHAKIVHEKAYRYQV